MSTLIDLLRWEGLLFLLALGILILAGMVTGRIRGRGLLDGITPTGARFASTGRTQLVIATVALATIYISQCLSHPGTFPEISPPLLLGFGGSHLLYLGSKLGGLRRKDSHSERSTQ